MGQRERERGSAREGGQANGEDVKRARIVAFDCEYLVDEHINITCVSP